MLSGSPEDMKYIRQAGQPDAWCRDSGGWLQKTFEKENGVSAVLHLNEKNAPYSRDRRAHRPGRAAEGQVRAGKEHPKRKENLPHQERPPALVHRRCDGKGEAQRTATNADGLLPLCRRNGMPDARSRPCRQGTGKNPPS